MDFLDESDLSGFCHLQTELVDDLEATDLELKMEIYPKWIFSYYYFLGCIIATF